MFFSRTWGRLGKAGPYCFALPILLGQPEALAHGVTPPERIDVSGHYDNSVGSSDAASQGVAVATVIDSRAIARAGDLIELVPGMVATQHSGTGKASQYFLRGLNLDHGSDFLTTVHGMPANMPSHAHGQGYADLNFIIPELVSRLDYRKGPYFASVGDFSSAGSAELRYFDALRRPITELTVGSFGHLRGVGALSGQLGTAHALAALEVERDDGPWQQAQGWKKHNAVMSLAHVGPSSKWKLAVMSYRGRWLATDQIPLREVESGRLDRLGTVDPTDGGFAERQSVSFEGTNQKDDRMVRVSGYLIRNQLQLFSNFTYFLVDREQGDQIEQREHRYTAGLDINFERRDSWLGLELDQSAGVQMRRDDVVLELHRSNRRARTLTISDDSVSQSSASAYVEVSTRPLPWFRVVAGGRYDAYFFEGTSALGHGWRTRSFLASPKLSAVMSPSANAEIFINSGFGFHSNDVRSLRQIGSVFSPLSPTRGSEVGIRIQRQRQLNFSAAIWRLNLNSELVFLGDSGTTEPIGASKRQGLEVSVRFRPTSWLFTDLDVAESSARLRSGSLVPGAAKRVVTIGATARHPSWTAGLNLRYFGRRSLTSDGQHWTSTLATVNSRVNWTLNSKIRFSMEIFNLFNRAGNDAEYFYSSQMQREPSPHEDLHFHPALGRHARLSIQLSL